MTWLRTCALALLLGLTGARLDAQAVTGRIVEPATQQPLAGVVVQLLDTASATATQALTNERGEYRLQAAPGVYRVRTLRIGFRPATSGPIRVVAGQDVAAPPLMVGARISLDTVRVVGRNQCRAVGDAAATFAVWEQARTALTAAAITGGNRVIGATVVTFERKVDPAGRQILAQYARLRQGFTTAVWVSLPEDSLRRVGYVTTDDRGWVTYYAPDLRVLLSDGFVEDHCFRMLDERGSGRIGIAFQPRRERAGIAGIRGTIWVGRATSELRSVEFRYTNRSDAEERAQAGGEMEFARMTNGAWVISRWNVRMPVLERRFVAASGIGSRARVPQTDVTEIRVEGGVVALVTQGADTLWRGTPLAIAGQVVDSASNAPAPGTRLTLRGSGYAAVTDSAGTFRFPEVLPGEYRLDVRTPRWAAFGALHTVPVTLTDRSLSLAIMVPDVAVHARAQCGDRPGGVVAGRVFAGATGAPRPGAMVVAEWIDRGASSDRAATGSRWLEVRTDGLGNYRLCGGPIGASITVRAQTDSAASLPARVTLVQGAPVATADLTADQPLPSSASFRGVVLSDINSAPILDAEVALVDLSRTAFSDANGAFRIADIPVGHHRVVIRRIGWEPRSLAIQVAAGQTVDQRVLLSRVQVLDTVTVDEGAGPPDFEENRRLGLGTFLTRADIERHEGRKLGDILRMSGKIQVKASVSGARAWIAGGRSTSLNTRCFELEGMADLDEKQGRNCGCFAQVYLDGMRLYGGEETGIVPDLNFISPTSIEAIEYYRGAAQTPMKYSTLNSNCGVIVIHTRRSQPQRKEAAKPPGTG